MDSLARLGAATVDVLTVLLDSDKPRWGLELIKATGRPSGTVYPLLDRLERAAWVTSHWDDDAARSGPRRRMYQLTPDGAVAAQDALRRVALRRTRPRGRAATPRLGMGAAG